MPQNQMGFIRLFQLTDFLGRKLDFQRGHGFFEMLQFGGADDRGGDMRLVQHPGQRDLLRAGRLRAEFANFPQPNFTFTSDGSN